MPSPFPGMDPYLEGEMWQEFHERLAHQISVQLMPGLAPKYVALLAKRYVLDRPALGITSLPEKRTVYPDVHVVHPPGSSGSPGLMTADASEVTAVVPSHMAEEVPILSVEVRDIAERRLVTLIEILSPANKRSNGFQEYAERRLELMNAEVHLLEIDLLRGGARIELARDLPAGDYFVLLSRWQRRPFTQVWAVDLRQKLPTVPVPLLPPDPDVLLDVQAAIDACFALVPYERLLDYTSPPPGPPLNPEAGEWAAQQLQRAGLSPSG